MVKAQRQIYLLNPKKLSPRPSLHLCENIALPPSHFLKSQLN